MSNHFLGFRCSLCGREYLPNEVQYNCPLDGGNLDCQLDFEQIQKQTSPEKLFSQANYSLWRYEALLPVNQPAGSGSPFHAAGWTPIFSPPAISRQLDLAHLWIKDESRNPTASFKDRASAIVVARAGEIAAEVVVTASTGNAGAALAGMAAAVGQKAIIFAPRTAPPAKVAQLLIFGAQVILVDGTYDEAFDLTILAAKEFGWYCRNTGYNPFTAEGKKTAGYEIWEQVICQNSKLWREKRLNIFVSVGDGNIISGIHKGFKDLAQLGWIDTLPRIFGVQAEGSAAIANAFLAGNENIIPVSANTLADSISVDLPRDGVRAVRAVAQTDGQYILVSDPEILGAIAALGKVGIFAEPAGATAYAGLVKAVKTGLITAAEPVLVLNTGSGLKDVKAAMQAVQPAPIIEPTLAALREMIK